MADYFGHTPDILSHATTLNVSLHFNKLYPSSKMNHLAPFD